MKKLTFDELFVAYEKARIEAKEATTIQDAMKAEIKERLEEKKLDEVDSEEFVCTYKFDKDKETVDTAALKKNKKVYAEFVALTEKIGAIEAKFLVSKPGARRLVIKRKNEEEE